jgi:hypothetical protein
MAILEKSFGLTLPPALSGAFKTFVDEVAALADAFLSPGRLIAEVEQMRALQLEADQVEDLEPERAASLRRQASRIGLR